MVEGTPGFPYTDDASHLLFVEGNMGERYVCACWCEADAASQARLVPAAATSRLHCLPTATSTRCQRTFHDDAASDLALVFLTWVVRQISDVWSRHVYHTSACSGRQSDAISLCQRQGDRLPSSIQVSTQSAPCVVRPCMASSMQCLCHSTLAANIRTRRGSKVIFKMPIFRDERTVIRTADGSADESKADSASPTESAAVDSAGAEPAAAVDGAAAPDGKVEESPAPVTSGVCSDDTDGFVHLDSMSAGMGMCCLQVTFQARDLTESLRLYDQLAVLGPIVVRAPFGRSCRPGVADQ